MAHVYLVTVVDVDVPSDADQFAVECNDVVQAARLGIEANLIHMRTSHGYEVDASSVEVTRIEKTSICGVLKGPR